MNDALVCTSNIRSSESRPLQSRKRPFAGFVLLAASTAFMIPSVDSFFVPQQQAQTLSSTSIGISDRPTTLVDPYDSIYASIASSDTQTLFRRSLVALHAKTSATAEAKRSLNTDSATTTTTSSRNTSIKQPLKPKSQSSKKRREEAMKAMQRTEVETALDGVDAQMLELLNSEQFLYPETSPPRPNGRPKLVPGAMNHETLLKFHQQDGVAAPQNKNNGLPNEYSYRTSATNSNSAAENSRPIKGSAPSSNRNGDLPEDSPDGNSTPEKKSTKTRKKVVKNLPARRKHYSRFDTSKLSKRALANQLDLNKYYKTELLTADEEYNLGIQVQLMVKCEEVHEGLALQFMRIPTIEEWAQACGFVEEDTTYVPTEGLEQIRPAGADSMFEEVDPNKFVGNGLAQTMGPGRGKGRVKQPPPTKLKDFYDYKTKKKGATPLNRGTTLDFVDMMMDARLAKQQMVQSNMRLVISIARKYAHVGVSLQDLVQEGSLGLSRAAEKFDPSKGFKFSTYASWWIQQAVFRSIAYHSRTIRLPVHIHNLLNKVRKVQTTLQGHLGRKPTNEEIAEALGMSPSKYNKMLQLTRRSISLEVPKYKSNPKDLGHESEDLLGDTIASSQVHEDDTSPERRVDRGLFQEDLNEMLGILDDDERQVISSRYGLDDGLTRTVTAVAAEMKQTKAWVRSQESKALRKLRRPWYEKTLREHQEALSV